MHSLTPIPFISSKFRSCAKYSLHLSSNPPSLYLLTDNNLWFFPFLMLFAFFQNVYSFSLKFVAIFAPYFSFALFFDFEPLILFFYTSPHPLHFPFSSMLKTLSFFSATHLISSFYQSLPFLRFSSLILLDSHLFSEFSDFILKYIPSILYPSHHHPAYSLPSLLQFIFIFTFRYYRIKFTYLYY